MPAFRTIRSRPHPPHPYHDRIQGTGPPPAGRFPPFRGMSEWDALSSERFQTGLEPPPVAYIAVGRIGVITRNLGRQRFDDLAGDTNHQ